MPQRAPPAPHSAWVRPKPGDEPERPDAGAGEQAEPLQRGEPAQRHARAESRVAMTTSVARLTACQYQAIAWVAFAR